MARKTTAKGSTPAEPVACPVCKGTGSVPVTVRVGRRRRPVGQQDGICLNCFGSGTDPNA